MKFKTTTAGLLAAFQASNLGPRIELPTFIVGSAFGYDPDATDTGIRGNVLYTGPTVGYSIIDANTCEFTLLMSETVGTFDFGEIALMMPDNTCFALGALQKPQYKVAYPDQDFNRFRINLRLTITEGVPIITWNVNNLTVGVILELDSVETLINPNDADSNAYICHSSDEIGNDAFCTESGTRWNINTHQHRVMSGTITSVGQAGRSIVASGIRSVSRVKDGEYLMQILSGIQQGTVRRLSRLDFESISWATPTLGVSAGDSFEILQSNHSYANSNMEEVAMFFSLLTRDMK